MLPPVRKTITVKWDQAAAFRRFTSEMSSWWPLRSHSVGQERADRVVFEERVGGRIYEVIRGGGESTWGTVTAWDPPLRVAFTWHPGRPVDTAQNVELRFEEAEAGTHVELVHTGWERFGPDARKAHRGYGLGWAYVLLIYAGRRHSPLVLALDAVVWIIRLFKR